MKIELAYGRLGFTAQPIADRNEPVNDVENRAGRYSASSATSLIVG